MRVLIWISRFLVPISLVMAILAALILARMLFALAPALPSDELAILTANVNTANSTLVTTSIEALDSVKSPESSPERNPLNSQLYGNAALSLNGSRNSELNFLSSLSGESKTEADTRLLASPELETALDQADAIYKEKLDKSTESAVDIYRKSMALEAPFYIKYLGFLMLSNVIERDILSYRELNSLELNDAKSTYYKDESDSNRMKAQEIRAEAGDNVRRMDEGLEAQYSVNIDELVNKFIEYAKSGIRQPETEQNIAVDTWVRGILDEFHPAAPLAFHAPDNPRVGVDTAAWVNHEKELVVAFGKASGVSEK
jgi:hypothetical protein